MELQNIRLATLEDADTIHALHTASVRALCRNAYSSQVVDGWLLNRTPSGYKGIEKGEMYVAELKGSVAGFSHVVPGEIVAIFVHPDHVRQGIGSVLVRHAMTKAQVDANGSVRVDSTLNAQRFYETMGFRKTGERLVRRNDVDIPIVEMKLNGT
jgi:ribosomal protein S18 acetylase RimI-like enzyme